MQILLDIVFVFVIFANLKWFLIFGTEPMYVSIIKVPIATMSNIWWPMLSINITDWTEGFHKMFKSISFTSHC